LGFYETELVWQVLTKRTLNFVGMLLIVNKFSKGRQLDDEAERERERERERRTSKTRKEREIKKRERE